MTKARMWAVAAVVTAGATAACVLWIDRRLAECIDETAWHTGFAVGLNAGLGVLRPLVVAAMLILFWSGWVRMRGGRPAAWMRLPLLLSWSVMWRLGAEVVLKTAFGRGWPDPTYLREGQYGFRWLHGVTYWNSFPSGTALIAGAIAGVVWVERERWRWAVGATAGALWVALVLSNDHWLADVIAGAFLGVTVGWMTVLLQGRAVAD